MIAWGGETYRFTEEDERVLQTLHSRWGSDDTFSVLGVVNAARAFERDRLIDSIGTLPVADQFILSNIVEWLRHGAREEKE